MKQELTSIGFDELMTPEAVEGFMTEKAPSAILVINSVCGCAAGQARPGVALALQSENKPQRLVTVFAGQDVEATKKVREYFADIPPSSPSIALFKEGELVYFLPRHRIESRSAQEVATDLASAFDRYFAQATATT